MGKSRRKYTREFKIEALKMVLDDGRTVTDVAEALGIDRSLLQRWKSEFKDDGDVAFPGNGRRKPDDEEIARLKRELSQARQERDILKKALAFFAKQKS
jgi:transposase